MPDDPVEAAFRPIYGLPCWNVKCGYGSFLTLEFGQPHLEIREPREPTHTSSIKVRRRLSRRGVTLRGDWHLWVYCCYWNFFLGGERIGDSTSTVGIRNTVRELDGQNLVGVSINHLPGRSVFEFDLGGRLSTRPFDKPHEQPREQWLLYEPSGHVLSFRADGMYSHHPGDTPRNQETWWPLPAPPASQRVTGLPPGIGL